MKHSLHLKLLPPKQFASKEPVRHLMVQVDISPARGMQSASTLTTILLRRSFVVIVAIAFPLEKLRTPMSFEWSGAESDARTK